MQVSIKKSAAIERKLTVSVPSAEIDREIEKRLTEIARRARIAGFRPGKAPQDIVNSRYGTQVTNEVVNDTISSSYRQALSENELVPAGLLSVEPKPFIAGKDLQYVATIELFPEIPAPSLSGRTLEKPLCTIDNEDIEYSIENIRKRNADFASKEEKAENSDRLSIDFVGKIDGEPFEGGSAQNHQFVLGEGQMLAEFDSGLLGATRGESKKIKLTFPKDYPSSQVAGKTAKFEVTVNAVDRMVLPELNDAFAEKLGIEKSHSAGQSIKKLREQVEVSVKRESAAQMRRLIRNRVLEELLKANPIEAPKALIESEINRMIQTVAEKMQAQGLPPPKESDIDRGRFVNDAKRQVMLGLIMREVIEKHDIKPEPNEVQERIKEMSAEYQSPTEAKAMIDWYNAEPARLQSIEAMLLEELAIAHLCNSAKVKEKKVSFAELMKLSA